MKDVDDADTAELDEDHEEAEARGDAEREGRRGAGGKAVESYSDEVAGTAEDGESAEAGASAEGRRRQRGQGRLCTAHERAGKAEDGGCDRPQADAGRSLSLLKLQILREAQKAVEHQRAAGKVRGEAEGRACVRRRVKMLKAAGGEADMEGRGGSG
eukprot:gene16001-biopygen1181